MDDCDGERNECVFLDGGELRRLFYDKSSRRERKTRTKRERRRAATTLPSALPLPPSNADFRRAQWPFRFLRGRHDTKHVDSLSTRTSGVGFAEEKQTKKKRKERDFLNKSEKRNEKLWEKNDVFFQRLDRSFTGLFFFLSAVSFSIVLFPLFLFFP